MKKSFLILVVMYYFCNCISAQEKIYMPYFVVINMHPDYQISVTHLFKTYLEAANKSELILPLYDSSYYSETKEQAISRAKSLNIDHVVIGELNRLGETVVISIAMYKVENGEKEWNVIEKALSPDDIDPIMQKIASNINNRNSINNSDDIYNVTDYNSRQLNKIIANTYWGVEIGGGATFVNVNNKFPAGFGIVYSGDLRSIIFDLKGSMYFSDINLYNLSVQINYPLINKISSPFIGGGLGYGYSTIKKDSPIIFDNYSGNGLTLYGGAGYIINRTSNINLRLNANLFFSMYKVNNMNPSGILFGVMVLF
jgi:hypothetical protein